MDKIQKSNYYILTEKNNIKQNQKKVILLNILLDYIHLTFIYQIVFYQNIIKMKKEFFQLLDPPNIETEELEYEIKRYNSTHNLFYFYPYKKSIDLKVAPTNEEGEITIKEIKPTIVVEFKNSFEYNVKKGIGPQYFCIKIDKNIKDEFVFNFGTKVNWFEGRMFDNDFKLNTGKEISFVNISANDAGKTYTAIYNNNGKFTAKKNNQLGNTK